jgi:L-ribulose-5-phosphate 4-epimerase
MADELTELRREVCALHAELPRHGLVTWTSGNLSARVPGEELMVIKASGIPYPELTPEAIVVCDLHGGLVEGDLAPSSDAATHGYIYRQLDHVGGVAHTHSSYATAWAARGEPIPCVLTAMADEFGGEIPIGPFALIGDDSIGRGIVETLTGHRSTAVLMRNHGVFTIGTSARAAVKSAVMCEDVARTVHIARQLGTPLPIPQPDIDSLYARYQNVYGQT